MTKKHIVAVLATSIIGFAAATASAQNPNFNNGTSQIVLGFQGINGFGGTNVVEVALDIAPNYRDASGNINNITNIGSLLTSTFGANWYESSDLFVGLGTVNTNIQPPEGTLNGDPDSTVYVSKARNSVGNEALAGSTIANATLGQLQTAANNLVSLQSRIELNGTQAAQTYTKSTTNTWEDYNQTNASGVQSTAFGFVTGGTQYRFGAGNLAFSNGNQEAALDLYRFQAGNDLPGQYGEGNPNGVGEYQGFFTIDNLGNVSFITATPVPEPSTVFGLGATALLGMVLRRRRTVVA